MSGFATKVSISFRGKKYVHEVECGPDSTSTVFDLKEKVLNESSVESIEPQHLKLLLGGRVLADDALQHEVFFSGKAAGKKLHKIIAMGMSDGEVERFNAEQKKVSSGVRVRDDISSEGRMEAARRIRAGKALNEMTSAKEKANAFVPFGRIETLPMLPERHVATRILTELANDPGIKECMKRRNWRVGCLAEMYPEGKVGVSEVCVMGLNQNKGEKIFLRLRTDDLKGWRKIQSVRKVLYHELSHNDISEHNGEFFALMRQVEKECEEMDWTRGAGGVARGGGGSSGEGDFSAELSQLDKAFQGGSGRLGGASALASQVIPASVMAASAAEMRLSQEEEEVIKNCGCGAISHLTMRPTSNAIEELFTKGEDVIYDTKDAARGWIDAKIVERHLANGVDEPYYTIRFARDGQDIEKQTTPERLKRKRI